MPRETNYRFEAKADGTAELLIYDDIGESWFGGITADMVARDLKAAGKVGTINVRINSQGGDVFEAFAIYNQLVSHSAKVSVTVDGLAASSASVIAMAGNDITMAKSSWMMIHDPWTVAMGNAEDIRKAAGLLDDMKQTIVNIYADRTGLDPAELSGMMSDETWLDGTMAKAKGFATAVNDNLKVAAKLSKEFRAAYRHVPRAITEERPSVDARAMVAAMGQRTARLTGRV